METFDDSLKYARHGMAGVAGEGAQGAVAAGAAGAQEDAVRQTCTAIAGRTDLSGSQMADHLAVLFFLAEAEHVPMDVLLATISKEKLMQSQLYQSIFKDGEKRGETRGIMALCEVLNIELNAERQAKLEQMDLDQLSALMAHLKSQRKWIDN